ncbi:bifunctional aldehyde dehydrogenase/enoyl-CoA hydratase [Klebsiella pneumoniae]|nr:bifunctional aldehyde dehydrogenase/enoyl-CoA hydratase [Klebsiella pneumoniae]
MQQLASYLSGAWQTGRGRARTIHHAITGAALWEVTSEAWIWCRRAASRLSAVAKPCRR